MTQNEAREAITGEWAALPPAGRSNEHQAAVFTMKAMPRYEFRCTGNRYQVIMGWLRNAFA
jgi:hypothetical protein